MAGRLRFAPAADDGEHVWGLPYHDGPQCLIYRRDLLEDERSRPRAGRFGDAPARPGFEHRLQQVAPLLWAERPRHEEAQPEFFAAFPDGHNSVYDFCVQLWSRGGRLVGEGGRPLLDTPEAAAALAFYRDVVRDRTLTPSGSSRSIPCSGELAAGAIAMMNWFRFACARAAGACARWQGRDRALLRGTGGSRAALNVLDPAVAAEARSARRLGASARRDAGDGRCRRSRRRRRRRSTRRRGKNACPVLPTNCTPRRESFRPQRPSRLRAIS
jgi:hypothetical protein